MRSRSLGFSSFSGTKRTQKRSLLDRPFVRNALIPKDSSSQSIKFSPKGHYTDNTDLTVIHKYALDHIEERKKEIPELDNLILKYQTKLKLKTLRRIDINSITEKLTKIQNRKILISSDDKRKEYIEEITTIYNEWLEIRGKEGNVIRFGEHNKFSSKKLSLVRSFIQIASNYVPLNLMFKSTKKSGVCPYCREEYSTSEEGKIICYDCGIYQDTLINDATFSDLNRINGANNNNYTNRENFIKTIDSHDGGGNANLPPELPGLLDEYCRTHRINKESLTNETTRPIFKSLGYSDYYKHINLFLSIHTGKNINPFYEYRSLLLQDYEVFSQMYEEIKDGDRDSALNSQYLLYILAKRRNIPCDKSEFKIPDTRTILLSLDNTARKVFKELNWKFVDTI